MFKSGTGVLMMPVRKDLLPQCLKVTYLTPRASHDGSFQFSCPHLQGVPCFTYQRAVGAGSMSHGGQAVGPVGTALGCPSAEDSAHEPCVPSSVPRRPVLGRITTVPHCPLWALCPGQGGGSAQRRVWTRRNVSSRSPLKASFVSFSLGHVATHQLLGKGARFFLGAFVRCLLFGLALGRLLTQILLQRNALREGSVQPA